MKIISLDSELVLLEVSGIDATVYLQGQLTNDIRQLTSQPYQLAAHLNNKGRMLASFIISSAAENSYYLITSRSIADNIIPRLKMFILRSKVSLIESRQSIYLTSAALDGCHSFAIAADCYLNIGPQGLGQSEKIAHKLLVDLAIPMIYPETQEKLIPQQVNYDLIAGINFKKGCYTGQEIVARTHYLGKVKRRMAYFSCQTEPTIGQTVVSPLLDNQEIGFIVDYYPLENSYRGLVSLQLTNLDNAFLDIENTQPLACTPIML